MRTTFKIAVILFIFFSQAFASNAQSRFSANAVWSNLSAGLNKKPEALEVDNSGVLYAGGDFSSAGGNSISRIASWNGFSWSSLGTGGPNKKVKAIAIAANNDVYIAGEFTNIGGVSYNYIAKWNGTSWSSLGSGLNNKCYGLSFDASGNLYAVGKFTSAGGSSANRVAVWNGMSWTNLGTGLNGDVNCVTTAPNGNVYVGGKFTQAGGSSANRVAFWNGASWIAMGAGIGSKHVNRMAVTSAGIVYVVGDFSTANGQASKHIASWNGSSWNTFGADVDKHIHDVVIDNSDQVFVIGDFSSPFSNIAKWNGSTWEGLGSGVNDHSHSLAIGKTGKLFAGGDFSSAGGNSAVRIAEWHIGFNSVQNGDWNVGSTWGNTGNTPGVDYPSAFDYAQIKASHRVMVSGNESVGSLFLESTSFLRVNSNKSLIISGSITNDGLFVINNNGKLVQTNCTEVNTNAGSGSYLVKVTGQEQAVCFNILSSPIETASISSVMSGSNPCDLFTFQEDVQLYKYDYAPGYTTSCSGNPVTFSASDVMSGADGLMDIGKGYYIPGAGASNKVKKFRGQINNGDVLVPVTTTGLGNNTFWDNDDWNLIGNPYPSAIDALLFWNENAVNNSRIQGAIYFWDDNGVGSGYNQNAEYASWNALGATSSSNTSVNPNNYIASGQGFWVYASSNTDVKFTNCMRSAATSKFFKQNESNSNIWIEVKSSKHDNNLLIGYNSETTDGYDLAFDAHKLQGNPNIKLAALQDGDEFSILGIQKPELRMEKRVAISVFSSDTGIHEITLNKFENIPSNMNIYLYDALNDSLHAIQERAYSFVLKSNVNVNNRFELIYKNGFQVSSELTVKTDKNDTVNNEVTSVEEIGENIDVVFQTGRININANHSIGVKVFTILGALVKEISVSKSGHSLSTEQLSNGTYILHVFDQSGNLETTKFIVQN